MSPPSLALPPIYSGAQKRASDFPRTKLQLLSSKAASSKIATGSPTSKRSGDLLPSSQRTASGWPLLSQFCPGQEFLDLSIQLGSHELQTGKEAKSAPAADCGHRVRQGEARPDATFFPLPLAILHRCRCLRNLPARTDTFSRPTQTPLAQEGRRSVKAARPLHLPGILR